MALVTQGYEAAVSLVDNGGNVSSLQYNLVSADFATAVTDTATVIAALKAVTNCVVLGYAIKEVFLEDAFAYPAAGIEIEDKASITVKLEGAGIQRANLRIPGPKIGIFTAATGGGANIVDVSDADLNTYVGLYKTTGGVATISDGEKVADTTPILSGRRVSVASTRG